MVFDRYQQRSGAVGVAELRSAAADGQGRSCGYPGSDGELIPTAAGTGIFAHAQVVADQAHVARELSHFLRDTARALGFDYSDSETAKPGYVFRAVAGTDTTAVLIIVPIENVVATVLDRPMAAVDLEKALRVGLFGASAGEAVGDFSRSRAGLFVGAVPLYQESLSHVRKVK